MTFHKLRQVKALSDIHRLLSGNKNFTPEWIAFIKKCYLQLKFGSWSLLKLFSMYAHSSIEVSLKKSTWNSSHTWPTEPTPRFDTRRPDTQLTTTSTKYLFPAKRSLLKLEVNKPGKQTIFQHFSEVNFLAALGKITQISLQLAGLRVLCPTWFQSANRIAGLTTLARRFPRQVCYLCTEIFTKEICRMLSQRKFFKRPFKAKWVLILQTIFGVCHWKIITEWWSLESWEQRGKSYLWNLSLKLKSCRNLKTKQLHTKVNKDLIFPLWTSMFQSTRLVVAT